MAYKYAQQAADLDDVLGYVFVAMMQKNGFGVKKNIKSAISYFIKAADQGHGGAMLELYNLYKNDKHVRSQISIEQVYEYLIKSIMNGYVIPEIFDFFIENYKILAPIFLKNNNLQAMVAVSNKNEVINLHKVHIQNIGYGLDKAKKKD